MFPKMEMSWSSMLFGPGSTTKSGTMVRRPVRNIALRRLIAYWTFGRLSALLSVLVWIVSTATVFAEHSGLPQGLCQASNSLSVLVRGKNVTAYVPKGSWIWDQPKTPGIPPTNRIAVVNIEGKSITPQLITTPNTPNSCASNSRTGETVCTANNNDVYLISGTTLQSTLTSGGSGQAVFSEGNCTNCGVTMDPVHNKALIGLSDSANRASGFQSLDLRTHKFETPKPIDSQAPNTDGSGGGQISVGIVIDPIRNIILSPNEHSNYEIVKLAKKHNDKNGADNQNNETNDDGNNNGDNNGDQNNDNGGHNGDHNDNEGNHNDNNGDNNTGRTQPAFFENTSPGFLSYGSGGGDCTTGIVLGSLMDPNPSDPSKIYIADLSHAKATPGSPAGQWTAPSQIQTLSESFLSLGANGIAIEQDSGIGIVTGEFGAFTNINADRITAIALPKDGDDDGDAPEIIDWMTCRLGRGFSVGFAPHTVAAYKSPRNGHAIALVADWDPVKMSVTTVAVIDLTKMLDEDIVPRTQGSGLGHACASDQPLSTGNDGVVRFIDVSNLQ
jgi:hypothetical protein